MINTRNRNTSFCYQIYTLYSDDKKRNKKLKFTKNKFHLKFTWLITKDFPVKNLDFDFYYTHYTQTTTYLTLIPDLRNICANLSNCNVSLGICIQISKHQEKQQIQWQKIQSFQTKRYQILARSNSLACWFFQYRQGNMLCSEQSLRSWLKFHEKTFLIFLCLNWKIRFIGWTLQFPPIHHPPQIKEKTKISFVTWNLSNQTDLMSLSFHKQKFLINSSVYQYTIWKLGSVLNFKNL